MTTSSTVPLELISAYMDTLLRTREIPDEGNAVNGLQVENRGSVDRIVAAVDASQATIDQVAGGKGRALLLVHHGLFWDGNVPLKGRRLSRIRALLDADIAVYSAHIPLDVHPELGNNVALARLLGVDILGWFGPYRGIQLGVHGALPIARGELIDRIDRLLHTKSRLIPGGPEQVNRIGVITGAGGGMIGVARDEGLDTLVTGEGPHHTYFDAVEWKVNVIYAGHYATETLGVQRLAEHVGTRFGLPWEFHDHDTGL